MRWDLSAASAKRMCVPPDNRRELNPRTPGRTVISAVQQAIREISGLDKSFLEGGC